MTYITAPRVADLAVGLLRRELVLPMTASRTGSENFIGGAGDTVTVRIPQPTTARKQATPGAAITYDTMDEAQVNVSVEHLYNATKITDEDMSLNLTNFGQQVTEKQVSAVAIGAENELANAINGLPAATSVAIDGSDAQDAILEAREVMTRAGVPTGDRWLAVSPEFLTFLLKSKDLTNVDKSGDDSALREAIVGRLSGFNVVESAGLTIGTACAYHRSAFAFATFTPVAPRGAASSASASDSGIGIRQIFQYDPDTLSDASVLSTFAGASLVSADRAFKFDTAAV